MEGLNLSLDCRACVRILRAAEMGAVRSCKARHGTLFKFTYNQETSRL